MNILCDVDCVVADLMPTWLEKYNHDWQDSLKVEDITIWGLHELVKLECGTKVYDYLKERDLYESVVPVEGAKFAVDFLRRRGDRVIFVTSGVSEGKANWLRVFGFIKDDMYDKDLVFATDKSLITGDILIDDKFENCVDRTSILFDQPWNRDKKIMRRAFGWDGVLKYFTGTP